MTAARPFTNQHLNMGSIEHATDLAANAWRVQALGYKQAICRIIVRTSHGRRNLI
jgi:hypothetical protein